MPAAPSACRLRPSVHPNAASWSQPEQRERDTTPDISRIEAECLTPQALQFPRTDTSSGKSSSNYPGTRQPRTRNRVQPHCEVSARARLTHLPSDTTTGEAAQSSKQWCATLELDPQSEMEGFAAPRKASPEPKAAKGEHASLPRA